MLCGRCGTNDPFTKEGQGCVACAADLAEQRQQQQQQQQAPQPTALPGWAVPRSPNGLARAVVLLLGAVILADLAAVVTGVLEYRFTARLLDGVWTAGTEAEGERLDLWYGVAGLAQGCMIAVTALVFFLWFFRVRHNGEVFDRDGHRLARPWLVFGFVVPVVNFWFPRRIALDIWEASAPDDRSVSHALINWWWGLWLVDQAVSRVSMRWYSSADALPEIKEALGAVLFSDALDIVAAVVAMFFVRGLTRLQNEKVLTPPAPALAPSP